MEERVLCRKPVVLLLPQPPPSSQRKVKSVGSDPNQVPRPELDYVTNARS